MKSTDLLEFLRQIYRDRLALRHRHVAAAAHVTDYSFNNTYQYVINRADGHVRWLQDAIEEMGGTAEELPLPEVQSPGKGPEGARQRSVGFAPWELPGIARLGSGETNRGNRGRGTAAPRGEARFPGRAYEL